MRRRNFARAMVTLTPEPGLFTSAVDIVYFAGWRQGWMCVELCRLLAGRR
jgi:hypothetical protein